MRAGAWHGKRIWTGSLAGSRRQWMEFLSTPAASHVTQPKPGRASLGPPVISKASDLGWDDIVSNIPEPLPKLRGVGIGHALDFGDNSALQGSVNILVTLLHHKHPPVGRGTVGGYQPYHCLQGYLPKSRLEWVSQQLLGLRLFQQLLGRTHSSHRCLKLSHASSGGDKQPQRDSNEAKTTAVRC